ncbi:MAG TPA: lysophospholipid acyltransferase family protein [Candidatus Hodarchaeales archaeon]|nr:lysophospholipid acyltransferase family protein [Candidatus Hodarchaeales archaeon]
MPSDREYVIVRGFISVLSKIFYRMRVTGVENLHIKPPYVISANHHSTIDAILLGLFVPYRIHFLGKQSALWEANKAWGVINDYFGTIPVRDIPGSNTEAMKAGIGVLRRGRVLGIFPEGAILAHKKAFEGKTGVARFSLEAGVPVIPVGILGTEDVLPYPEYGQPPIFWPRVGRKVELHIRPALNFPQYSAKDAEKKEILREVTDTIMREIRIASKGYGCPIPYLRELLDRRLITKEHLVVK